jgi:hypothetical protein
MLPYLVGDEVWGVAKIYDQDAAQLMLDHDLSTSPSVIFRDPSVNAVRKLESGRTLLIEGKPTLLDHLAICEAGVWDKGGDPTGVAKGEPDTAVRADSTGTTKTVIEGKSPPSVVVDQRGKDAGNPQESTMAENEKPAGEKKTPSMEEKIDAMCDSVASLAKRMDAFDKKDAKKDDDDRKDAKKEEEDDKDAKKDGEEDDDAKKDGEGEEEDEKDKDKKDDDKRKDAEGEEGEGKGEPEPMASDDDRRKDKRKDAKKDGEDKKDDDRRDDARHDALKRELKDLRRMMERTSRQRSDEETNALAELQHSWSVVAQSHGDSVARPMDGESVLSFDRRQAKRFQKYSERWKGVDLSALPPSVMTGIAAPEVRTDSIAAARIPVAGAEPTLREIVREDRTGRRISEFVGSVEATLAPFKLPTMRVKQFNKNPSAF